MIQTSFKFKEPTSEELSLTKKVLELSAPVERRFTAYKDQMTEIHRRLPTVKLPESAAQNPQLVLAGKDQASLQIKKVFLKKGEKFFNECPERVFSRYYEYSKVSPDTVIPYNLLNLIEDDFYDFKRLLEHQPGLQIPTNTLELRNQGWELWWDNAKVEFTYNEYDELPFKLKFQNGRTLAAAAKHISQCPELSSNIQLSIASRIANYIGFELDLSKVEYSKTTQTYNYLGPLESAHRLMKIRLLDHLAENRPEGRSVQLLNTGITLDLDTLTTRTVSTSDISVVLPTDNLLSELLLTKAVLSQLEVNGS